MTHQGPWGVLASLRFLPDDSLYGVVCMSRVVLASLIFLPVISGGCSAGGNDNGLGIAPADADVADTGLSDGSARIDVGFGYDVRPITDRGRIGDLPRTDGSDLDATSFSLDSGFTLTNCDGGHALVTGVTLAPNGVDPIPGVRVVLLPDTATFAPAANAVTCDHCVPVPSDSVATQLSGTNGAFTLSSPVLDGGGTFTLEMLSGGFRHVLRHVAVPRCGSLSLTAAQTSFSGATTGDDTIPTIAVAGIAGATSGGTNVNDNFITVLTAIGITGYDVYNPDRTYPTIPPGAPAPHVHDLLEGMSPTPLSHYQIVILPCGTLGNYTVQNNLDATAVTNLQTWLNAGGRLYASDLSYPAIAQPFSSGITFAPGPSSHAGAPPADVGVGQARPDAGVPDGGIPNPLIATVDDANLQAWLNALGATTGNTIPITELKNPWGAVSLIPPTELTPDRLGSIPGKVWVSGDVAWHGTPGTAVHPLTVQVDYPGPTNAYCGRVAFTSYHVQTASTVGMPATALSPQERVLEYLFFQLTTCIQCSLTAGCTH